MNQPSARRYFISHSSAQKDLAIELKLALEHHAWVDLHEIELGDILLDEIADGIESATDYVLLWSDEAADSNWVKFEFHMAFARWLEERSIALRIVLLSDTTIPLYFRPFLQLRLPSGVSEIVGALQGAPPSAPRRRSFVDRHSESGHIESALNAPDRGLLVLYGVSGIGKRTLARETLRRLLPDSSRVRTLTARPGYGEVELGLAAAAALSTEYGREGRDRAGALDALSTLLGNWANNGGIWIVEDVHPLLQEWDGRPDEVLQEMVDVLADATSAPDRLAIFTSVRRPNLKPDDRVSLVEVRGLGRDDAVALLQSRGSDEAVQTLQRAATQLDGHPLGLELISGYPSITEVNWAEERARIGADVLGAVALEPTTEGLMETLSTSDGPLPIAALAAHLRLTSADIQKAINEASQYALIRDDRNAFLTLHPLVKDLYFLRARRRDSWSARVSDLATRSVSFLRRLEAGTPVYVDTLVNAFRLLGLAGRLEEAVDLRADLFGALEQAAVELYRTRNYALAAEYFDQVLAADPSNISARLYLARALASVGEFDRGRAEVAEANRRSPNNPYVFRVLGRVEYLAGNLEAAVKEYQRALSTRPSYRQVRVDLAQTLIRLDSWALAREYVEPVATDNPNPFVLSIYSQILEHDEEWGTALRFMSRASRMEPENSMYHHRLGRIAEQLGNSDDAATEYARAIELDPDQTDSKLSLASLLVDSGQLDDARVLIDSIENPRVRTRSVIHNIEARALLSAGEVDQARDEVAAALSLWRSPQNLGLACEVEIAAVEQGSISKEVGLSRVQIYVAEFGPDSQDYAKQLQERLDD